MMNDMKLSFLHKLRLTLLQNLKFKYVKRFTIKHCNFCYIYKFLCVRDVEQRSTTYYVLWNIIPGGKYR